MVAALHWRWHSNADFFSHDQKHLQNLKECISAALYLPEGRDLTWVIFAPQHDQTGFSTYPRQAGDCISAVLGLPEEPDFILHKLHSLWGDLVFVDKECQSFDGHRHLFPLGQVRVPENTPSQPAKNIKEKVLVVTNLGNQHNNGPHLDQIFDSPSALCLALWA